MWIWNMAVRFMLRYRKFRGTNRDIEEVADDKGTREIDQIG
jgi:hypothetical protein